MDENFAQVKAEGIQRATGRRAIAQMAWAVGRGDRAQPVDTTRPDIRRSLVSGARLPHWRPERIRLCGFMLGFLKRLAGNHIRQEGLDQIRIKVAPRE